MNWIKSSRCVGGECVEVAADAGAVHVRDTGGRQITVTPAAWTAFLAAIRAGHYDQGTRREGRRARRRAV